MKRRLAVLAAIASAVGAVPAVGPVTVHAPLVPATAKAHSCSSGYTHAHLPWGQKCLRRGQYCKRSGDRSYHRYGYHCHRYYSGGYRLTR